MSLRIEQTASSSKLMIPDLEPLAQRGNSIDIKYRQTTKWTMAALSGNDEYFTYHLSQQSSLLTCTSGALGPFHAVVRNQIENLGDVC